MKLARSLTEVEAKKVQSFVLFGGVFTTLAIWTKLEDPINLPKMFVLVMFAAIALGLSSPVLLNSRNLASASQKIGLGLVWLFIAGLLISTVATDVKYIAIFGEYHRNNGALTLLASAVFALAAGLTFNQESGLRALKVISTVGFLLSIYGIFQFLGKDPVTWSNQYNPIITTLGNPNFTSGLVGIGSIANLYLVIESKKILNRTVAIASLTLGMFVVIKSASVQGIFAFTCGAAILVLVKAWDTNRKLGIATGISLTLVGIPIALAVFNVGPLASRLYQGTLNNRLDYWHAALNMFHANPIFGVGIDRYGEYYREYAVQNQFVQGMFSNNAHNVYLHLLATGGLVLFIPYLSLLGYVTWLSFKGLRNSREKERSTAAAYLGIWLGFLLLNIVTIDNIGVGIWLWIFGGIIIARTAQNKGIESEVSNSKRSKNRKASVAEISFAPNVVALALTILVLIFCVPLLSNSTKLIELKFNIKGLDQSAYSSELLNYAKSHKSDSQTLANLANFAIQKNELETALEISKMIGRADERSFYGSFLPAIIYEGTSQRAQAITYREKLLVTDKWNTANMLELVKSYLEINKIEQASKMAAKIEKLYPGSPDSREARSLIEKK